MHGGWTNDVMVHNELLRLFGFLVGSSRRGAGQYFGVVKLRAHSLDGLLPKNVKRASQFNVD